MKEKLDRKDPRFKKIQITVDAYLPWIEAEDGVGGEGLLTFLAFPTDVFDPIDTDKKIGTVGGGLGAVTLSQPDEDGMWMIHHDDLWFAFLKALEMSNE